MYVISIIHMLFVIFVPRYKFDWALPSQVTLESVFWTALILEEFIHFIFITYAATEEKRDFFLLFIFIFTFLMSTSY